MKLFDSHCHLAYFMKMLSNRIRVVDEAKRNGIIALANISTNLRDFPDTKIPNLRMSFIR